MREVGNERHIASSRLPGAYHHFDHHLFLICSNRVCLRRIQHVIYLGIFHPGLTSLTNPSATHHGRIRSRQGISHPCRRQKVQLAILSGSNIGRSATSALPNSAAAQVHPHQRHHLRILRLRQPHRPRRRTNPQSKRTTLSRSWASRTRPRRPSRSTSHLRLLRSAPTMTRPSQDHARKPQIRSRHGKIASSVRCSVCH